MTPIMVDSSVVAGVAVFLFTMAVTIGAFWLWDKAHK